MDSTPSAQHDALLLQQQQQYWLYMQACQAQGYGQQFGMQQQVGHVGEMPEHQTQHGQTQMPSEQRMMGQLATFGQTSFAAAPAFVSGGVLGSAGHTSLVAAPAFASGGGLGSSNFSEARDHNASAYGAAPAFVSAGMLGSGGDRGQKRERSAPARSVADDEIDDDLLNPGISEARGGHAAHHV
eukprot:CAMPEP_0203936840 /NCGR_PEP_ID=MMETSP0359-20131031/74264_1 /ASSEMBLY_ACC=CAM_ASM_000338 /TAXON_ID=268821 /ORGANISM="Scrippsiella Hangoei, Strain SHTV-5" /LENGTH=183 /DNA_ID=CAMNT_0050866859 /DNA_START=175 /DNA_END=723 /DNA_ORIENTATION=+